MSIRTARAHRRRRYSNPFMDEYMPCIGPNEGLTFCAPLIRDDRPLYSAAGTTAMSTKTVDADGTIPNFWQDNLIHDVTLNVPRISGDGVLSEVASTNLATNSEAAGSWPVVNNATVTPNSDISPDGAQTADTMVDAGAAALLGQQWIGTLTDNLQYTFSLFLKAGTASQVTLRILDTTASADRAKTVFDWTAGVLSVNTTSHGTAAIKSYGNGWYRASVTCPVNVIVGASNNRALVYTGNIGDADTGQTAKVWGFQFEQQASATSYIPTTTAAVVRSGDTLKYAGTSNISKSAGTAIISVTPNAVIASGRILSLFGDADNRIELYNNGGKPSMYVESNNVVLMNKDATAAMTAGTRFVAAMVWGTNDGRLYINGGDEQTDTDVVALITQPDIYVGVYGGGNLQGAYSLGHLCIYNRALSAGEILDILHIDYTRWLRGTGWAPAA